MIDRNDAVDNLHNHIYSISTSHTEEFTLENHGEERTNTSITDDETISIPWDPYDILDSTVGNIDSLVVNANVLEFQDNDDGVEEEWDIPTISKEDLNIVAHTFFTRRKELESVSYPDPFKTEEEFYDCQQHDANITHVTIMKVETSNSGNQAYEQTKLCLQATKQENNQCNDTTEDIE